MKSVEIDPDSGFCGGVIRAIKTAEDYLSRKGGALFSLGAIVHNEEELTRLESLGLVTIDQNGLDSMKRCGSGTMLIRAHGVPPAIYAKVRKLGFEIMDCTCPVVLKLQQDIRKAQDGGQIVIFGKKGHPEVLGLVGQTDGRAVVVESPSQYDEAVAAGRMRKGVPVELFSQTTMSPEGYNALKSHIEKTLPERDRLIIHDTICSQVAHRHSRLSEFARAHDIIIFVSGKHSSNGKVLYDLCRANNGRCHLVSNAGELRGEWFLPDDRVGIAGATSTPKWLLEQVAKAIS